MIREQGKAKSQPWLSKHWEGIFGVLLAFSSRLVGSPSPHLGKETEAAQAAHDAVNFREALAFAAGLVGAKQKAAMSITVSEKETSTISLYTCPVPTVPLHSGLCKSMK